MDIAIAYVIGILQNDYHSHVVVATHFVPCSRGYKNKQIQCEDNVMMKNVPKLCRLIGNYGLTQTEKSLGRYVDLIRYWSAARSPRPQERDVCRERLQDVRTRLVMLATGTCLVSPLTHRSPWSEQCDASERVDKEMLAILSRVKKLIDVGSLSMAETLLEGALDKTRERHQEWYNVCLLLLGKIALRQGEHTKSEERYMELSRNLSQVLDISPSVEKLKLWTAIDLAQLYSETKRTQKAEEQYIYSIHVLEVMFVDASEFQWAVETLHNVLDGYALLLVNSGRLAEALAYRQQAYQLCLTLYGDRHNKIVYDLNELGRIYTYQGKDEEAIDCFTRAIQMAEGLEGSDPMEIAALRVNSGVVMLRRGLISKAKESCRQALEVAKKMGNKEGVKHATECLDEVQKAFK